MTLESSQSEMQERSQDARKKRASKNARSPRKVKQPPRTRVSEKTLLRELAQDPSVPGKVRYDAIQQLLLLGGSPVLPVKEPKNEEPQATSAPAFRGSDLAPAKPV